MVNCKLLNSLKHVITNNGKKIIIVFPSFFNKLRSHNLNADGSYTVTYHKEGNRCHYHRKDGPAFIDYREDGSISGETWVINGKCHREGGPAVVHYNKDGSIFSESWWVDNKRHREGAPAIIYYNKDGSISSESWWINGKRHREGAPAAIDYNKDGSISSEYWVINDKPLSEKQINNIKKNLAFNRWLEQELDHESS